MDNLFEGEPDARQTDAPVTAPQHSLFRKRYRKLTEPEVALQDAIKDKADELAVLIGLLNPATANRLGVHSVTTGCSLAIELGDRDPANVTLAIRHLEDAVYRAVKALTA
jgi:hypothetical protein